MGDKPRSYTLCVECGREDDADAIRCAGCAELVEVRHQAEVPKAAKYFEKLDERRRSRKAINRSGVWRYRELVAPSVDPDDVVTQPEGNTPLYESKALGRWAGLEKPIFLKHEGMNPTGSFKDRGMTVGVSVARARRARAVACASTGNTSASLASYAALAGLRAVVFIPEGKVAHGKLAQTLAYGARVIQVQGSFDRAMTLVEEAARALGLYLLNSVNPWRIEGQKAIVLELLQDLSWEEPDWIALPAGNLGNTSAFGKAIREALEAKLIHHAPRLASIQAEGASPFARLWRATAAERLALVPEALPETVATAIRIGDPRSWRKAYAALKLTGGTCDAVSDQEILEAKAAIDRAGIGCEPASAASLAGVRKLVLAGTIRRDAKVACILTGHVLKDPETTVSWHTDENNPAANRPVAAPDTIEGLRAVLAKDLGG